VIALIISRSWVIGLASAAIVFAILVTLGGMVIISKDAQP
jgi:hypothetical protein